MALQASTWVALGPVQTRAATGPSRVCLQAAPRACVATSALTGLPFGCLRVGREPNPRGYACSLLPEGVVRGSALLWPARRRKRGHPMKERDAREQEPATQKTEKFP